MSLVLTRIKVHLGIDFAHFRDKAFAAPTEDALSRPGTLFQTLAMTLAAIVG